MMSRPTAFPIMREVELTSPSGDIQSRLQAILNVGRRRYGSIILKKKSFYKKIKEV